MVNSWKEGIPFVETGKTQIPSAAASILSRFKYLLIASVFVVVNLLFVSFSESNVETALTLNAGESLKTLEDVCIKSKIDYFDPEIMKFYENIPKPECTYKENTVTRLLKGKLLNLLPDTRDCWGRPAETSKFNAGGKQYDVYFIIVDSQSHSQMFRNMQHTKNYLLNEFEGVIFPYMNRVGGTSRTNSFAWYFGKMYDAVDRSVFFMPSVQPEPEWHPVVGCGRKLDNETMILTEFRDYGYMTIDAPDQWRTIDYGCEGADVTYSHHTYLPYFLTLLKKTELPNYVNGAHYCRQYHTRTFNYFSKFVASYQDKPKMGHLWLTFIGHDSEVGSVEADVPFVEFFKNHRKTLDNSFIILGGDHGFRQSDILKTKVGAVDVNNPALIMNVPKELRKNSELMATLRENAEELQTHYDTRATLLDILKYQPSTNYSNQTTMDIRGEFGHSFLRRQPKPRTCRTLPIPPSFCLCEKYMRKDIMKENPSRAEIIGKLAIDSINKRLRTEGVENICRKWAFAKTEKLFQVEEQPQLSFEGVVKATNNRSIEAEFFVYLAGKTENSVEVFNHDRMDHYGDSGNCVARKILQSSCDCL